MSKEFVELQNLSTEISDMITTRKEEYYVPDQKLIGRF